MKNVGLNFICKNESHVIERMLDSVKSFTDLIVAVDTGSTDDTIDKIKSYGRRNNIPTYVFQRPFDNFCNSRNYALDKLRETSLMLGWDMDNSWGFHLDCDEIVILTDEFSKESLVDDFYFMRIVVDNSEYNRQIFYHLSKEFKWVGPIHEFITFDTQQCTYSIIDSLTVYHNADGGSWNSNLEAKFLNYVEKLKEFIAEGNNSFRWHYFLAESYVVAAIKGASTPERKAELLHLALDAYAEASLKEPKTKYDNYILSFDIANIKSELRCPLDEIRSAYQEAYAKDSRHAEPIRRIIRAYLGANQWQIAYLYCRFAATQFHGEVPRANDLSNVERDIYLWKTQYWLASASFYAKKYEECRKALAILADLENDHPEYFDEGSLAQIKSIRAKLEYVPQY